MVAVRFEVSIAVDYIEKINQPFDFECQREAQRKARGHLQHPPGAQLAISRLGGAVVTVHVPEHRDVVVVEVR